MSLFSRFQRLATSRASRKHRTTAVAARLGGMEMLERRELMAVDTYSGPLNEICASIAFDAQNNRYVAGMIHRVFQPLSRRADRKQSRCLARAMVWDDSHGTRDLGAVLPDDFGIADLSAWARVDVRFMTDDRKTIGGSGNRRNGMAAEGWLVHLDTPFGSPVPEPSNLSGMLLGLLLLRRRAPA